MKKFLLTLVIVLFLIPLSVIAAEQNFNTAKTKLVKLYTSNPKQKEFYCGCDFSFQGKKSKINLASCGYKARKNQKRAERIEWEHVMPAENFGHQLSCWKNGGRKACKKEPRFNKMEGDMHNLQPAIGEVNGDRSNYGYSAFTRRFDQYGSCKTAIDFKARKFQPRDEIRGVIARTYLYMQKQYAIKLSSQDLKLMNAWNNTYPVSRWECLRNREIAKQQGNDNPFITHKCISK